MFGKDSRDKGRDRLARLREQNRAQAEAMRAEAEKFGTLRDPASAPRVVSAFNLFQTPEGLAFRMAEALAPGDVSTILEPSAGLGRLFRAVRRAAPACWVSLVDNSPECCRELYNATAGDAQSMLFQRDFLAIDPKDFARFDRVIMNPPFKNGADILHIQHAMKFLQPWGRLVALCANGPKQNAKLRPTIESMGGTWQALPAHSFRGEGTDVNAAMIVLEMSNRP